MKRKKLNHLTVTDQFCGAGGSSQGARNVSRKMGGGLEVTYALNHWKLAIETHETNFPDTKHDCTDISACDPRRYPSTDFLITSPECTTHTPAGGNNHKQLKKQMDMFNTGKIDPATERSRATMWDVCRFAEYHSYNFILVENVVEAKTRWPLFDTWLNAMNILGYNSKLVFLNSMHAHPTPQSRDRMYVAFWKKGNKAPNFNITPEAFCVKCMNNVNAIQSWKPNQRSWKYRTGYVYCCPTCASVVEPYYYAAFNCIDWSDPGTRIGDRKKPLMPNTRKRIQYGIDKYGFQPLQVTTKYHLENIEYGSRLVTDVMRTQCSEQAHGILNPFLVDEKQSTGISFRVRSAADPVNTLHTDPRVYMVSPYIISLDNTFKANKNVRLASSDPLQSQTTFQTFALINPILTEMCSHGLARQSTDPLSTIRGGGIHNGVVTPEAWNSFISYYYGTGDMASHISEAANTFRAGDVAAIVSSVKPNIDDCYYRMLKPPEIKLGMAFDKDYIILGSGKNQVKQCGNAVTPPVMELLIQRCVDSLK